MHVKYILDAQNVESVGKNCKMGVDGLTQVVNLELALAGGGNICFVCSRHLGRE